jgi:hypothetical protein
MSKGKKHSSIQSPAVPGAGEYSQDIPGSLLLRRFPIVSGSAGERKVGRADVHVLPWRFWLSAGESFGNKGTLMSGVGG